MEERTSLAEALENTGMKKKFISERLGITPQYYSMFIKRKTINRAQATVISMLTGMSIDEIDVEVR